MVQQIEYGEEADYDYDSEDEDEDEDEDDEESYDSEGDYEDDEDDEDDEDEYDDDEEEDDFDDEDDGDEDEDDVEDGTGNENFNDEPKPPLDEARMKRNLIMLGSACCCLVILAAVLIGVLVGGKDDKGTSSVPATPEPSPTTPPIPPTALPTISPAPSIAPSPIPQLLSFPIIADTYISEEDPDTTFGSEETLLVRSSGDDNSTISSLLEFDLSDLPPANIFSRGTAELILRLTHITNDNGQTSTFTVAKVPFDNALDVETLTWMDFDDVVEIGPTFTVEQDTETVEVDITSLIRPDIQLRGRRLQSEKVILQLLSEDDSALLSEAFVSSQGDEDARPVIVHNYFTESPSGAPSVSQAPSAEPTLSAAPSLSNAPTVSIMPSGAPSLSSAPTTSSRPSLSPSVAPSLSTQPTSTPSVSIAPSTAPSSLPSGSPSLLSVSI